MFRLDEDAGRKQLDHWIKWAQRSRIPAFVELQRKIRRHYGAIMATLENGLSNARIEAVNNKRFCTNVIIPKMQSIASMPINIK